MTAVVTLIFGLIGKHAFDFYRKIRAGAYIEGINVKQSTGKDWHILVHLPNPIHPYIRISYQRLYKCST